MTHQVSFRGWVSFWVLGLSLIQIGHAGPLDFPDYIDCVPASPNVIFGEDGPDPVFCSEWNPDFGYRGRCCPGKDAMIRAKRAKKPKCDPKRSKRSFCDEMTDEQRFYWEDVEQGRLGDVLDFLTDDLGSRGKQAYCGVNDGFLAFGRPIIPSEKNRIQLRTAGRCTNFGTDPMVAMLEWLGRQMGHEYSAPEFEKVRLLVGDVSAPRGGCIAGRGGRRGHASHTNGQDADLGFVVAQANRASPDGFHQKFEPKANWWFVKQLFNNPYACIKVVFLDRLWIRKLAKVAAGDPEWPKVSRFIRHVKNHRNHYHVRIGDGPGRPGCLSDPQPELEPEDELNDDGEELGNSPTE